MSKWNLYFDMVGPAGIELEMIGLRIDEPIGDPVQRAEVSSE